MSVKDGTASFEWGGWDAARELDFDVERDVFGGFDDIMDAVHAKDVGELMRVGDDGSRAMWDDHRGEFLWGALGRFDVDMSIDEAWDNGHAGDVIFHFAFVALANADDAVIFDGDIPFFDLSVKEIDV